MRKRRPGRLRRLWAAVRRHLPGFRGSEPPAAPPWGPEEPALVPLGPPRRPRPSTAAVLDPPAEIDPLEYPTETDAVGEIAPPEDDEDEDVSAATGS